MLDALADSAVRSVKTKMGVRPRVEGLPQDGWILADYGDVILHLFSPGSRRYYGLEELWSDGTVLLHVQ